MSQNAFDVGAPIPTVNAAVEARLLSALKSERVVASKVLQGPAPVRRCRHDASELVSTPARQALYAGENHLVCAGDGAAAPGIGTNTNTTSISLRSRGSGAPGASSARRCSRTSAPRSAGTQSLVNLMLDESFSRGARVGTAGAARGRADGRRCGDSGARH